LWLATAMINGLEETYADIREFFPTNPDPDAMETL
jgi:hypothetical protein